MLAGCSSGGSDDAATDVPGACVPSGDAAAAVTRSPGVDSVIAVAADDDTFSPACVEIAAGDLVTIVVRNVGAHPHNLTLPNGAAVSVDAGQVGLIDAHVGSEGLRFVCTLHEKMVGELRVVG